MYKLMRVIIAGSRDITEIAEVIQAVKVSGFSITEIVCGKAKGADTLGELYGISNRIPVKPFPADWYPNGKFFKGAGHVRNRQMGDYADALIAVWDGVSSGTKGMIEYMKSLNKPTYIHIVKEKR